MKAEKPTGSFTVAKSVIDTLLGQIAREYYSGPGDRHYHAHRRGLIHAICWPANWFQERSIHLSDSRYKAIIQKQLRQIHRHGDGKKARAYFPKYLLTCLQNHFLYQGDHIYERYKHVRYSLERLLEKLPDLQQHKTNEEMIDVLSQAHRITQASRNKKPSKDYTQLKFDFQE
jgi:hypothetical protein